MALKANALTTVARLKNFLGITANTYDTILEIIINAISDTLVNDCNRVFLKTAYTKELLNGSGNNQITIPNFPIDSSATFKLYSRSGSFGEASWNEINGSDYRIDYDNGIITASFDFTLGTGNYAVDFTGGYDFDQSSKTLESIGLSDLELAVWKLCGDVFNERKGGGDIQTVRLYNYSVTYMKNSKSDKDAVVQSILDNYTVPSF